MPAKIIDGKALSAALLSNVQERAALLAQKGITPGLAVILAGDDPASQIYVRNKQKACEKAGVLSKAVLLPNHVTQQELETEIKRLNEDKEIHGILLQLPLPAGLNEEKALRLIAPQKDVDGFHVVNSGLLMRGQKGVIPCTPKGIMAMLYSLNVPLDGMNAVVVGRSNLVGKPIALLLLQENCTVTICHSKTKNLAAHTRQADILIAAVGKPYFITADMVKPGAIVIDVGINRVESRVVGDVAPDVWEKAGYISPVPGGVGKMTVAELMENTVEAAEDVTV